jgi:hypothetical protein
MIGVIANGALRLDQWLEKNLGRPYNALLGIGLMTEIVRQSIELSAKLRATDDIVRLVFPLLLESALLIHQVGALSHRFENRKNGGSSNRRRNGSASD